MGKTKRGKGTKLMALADGSSLPISVYAASTSPHELTLVGETLSERVVEECPLKLVGDRAYDSDPLDEALMAEGIEMIAARRRNRKEAKNSRWAQAPALQETLEGGAIVCLAWQLPALGCALRATGRELFEFCTPRVRRHPVEVFMR